MKWVKKALAVTLAAMLVLPSIGALADEAEPTTVGEVVEQQPAAEPGVPGENGKTEVSETVSGNDAAGEETTADEMETEAAEDAEPAREVQPDTLAETQAEIGPASEIQADPAKVVRYNTGNCVMAVADEETLNAMGSAFGELEEDAEIPDAFPEFPDVKTWNWGVFEDGNFTINIPEENPFFPYEVQFTYQGKTWSEWFMSPEDTVEIGGHTFAVSCAEEITQINLKVAGDTVVVYPERKEFTNDGAGISAMSLLPLETYDLEVDLTGYTPVELTMVKMDGEFKDGPAGAAKIAWSNQSYSYNGNYIVSGVNDSIDLSWGTSRYGNNSEWEMIVGDGDQLNAANIRYHVNVKTTSSRNWLTPTIYAQDSQGNRSAVKVNSFEYYDSYGESMGPAGVGHNERYLWSSIFSGEVENKDRYLALSADVSGETYTHTNVASLKIFKGFHTTVSEATASEDITAQVMEGNMAAVSAGYKAESSYRERFTMIAYDTSGSVIGCLPFAWSMSSTSDSLYVRLQGVSPDPGSNYIYYNGQNTTFYNVPNGSYPLVMEYRKGTGSNTPDIEAVFVGQYESIAAAGSQENIKDKVFGANAEGYSADFSNGVAFTVFLGKDGDANQKIYTFTVKTMAPSGTTEPSEPSKSSASWITFYQSLQDEDGNPVTAYMIRGSDDSYGDDNFITYLVDANLDLEAKKFAPGYYFADKATVFTEIGNDEVGKPHSFADGAVQYSVSSEDGSNVREYWVQIKNAPDEFGQLYISSLVHDDSETHVGKEDHVTYSKREVMLDSYHNYVHDICFANIGSDALNNLSAELTSDVLELDPYWTLNGKQALQGMGTVEKPAYDSGKEGELSNLAKVRLRAKADVERGTDVTGTLTVKSGDKVLMVLELTGVVGDPCIVTKTIPDAVKYVPYSAIIQTSNKYSWIKVSYEVSSGRLPEGVSIKPNGELYGVPQETGSFTFRIRVDFNNTRDDNSQSQYAIFTLNVKENTNANVYNESDENYDLITPVGVETSAGSYDFYLENIVESKFVSKGEFDNFMDLWLNGQKLEEEVDYTVEEGSTVITIRAQTLQNKAAKSGNNTIAAEFREGADVNNTLYRTAQNFHLDKNTGSGGNSGNEGGSGSGGNSGNGSGSGAGGNSGNGSGSGSGGNSGNGSGSGAGGNSGNGGSSANANVAEGVTIAGCVLDASGSHLAGVTVELHSTPRSTVTDENGFFQFTNVEYGQHELFVKDRAGNIMASQKFELQEGGTVALNGFVLTVPKGGTIPLAVKVANGTLTFSTTGNAADAAAQAAAAYAASAATGDDENPVGWLLALLVSGCLAAGVVVYYRKKARIL